MKVPEAYAIGQQDTRGGFTLGGDFEDDASVVAMREGVPRSECGSEDPRHQRQQYDGQAVVVCC